MAIDSGMYHTCAVLDRGDIQCWGHNYYGQLGDGTYTNHSSPQSVYGLSSSALKISTGGYHTCSLTSNDEIKCWGWNWHGQLGDGTTGYTNVPITAKTPFDEFTLVDTGGNHTCALTKQGEAICWGENFFGQLGVGELGCSSIPEAVLGIYPWDSFLPFVCK